jgi:uncharacterized repeat protein (TIGR03803 family)
VLHSFTNTPDGAYPIEAPVIDKVGELYGITISGGSSGDGTVFKLDTSGNETVLHSFTNTPDGASPTAGLVIDKAGNLYGGTEGGGSSGDGTVFKLDITGTETVLYSFTAGAEGNTPAGALVLDAMDNLYGTTLNGGVYGGGTVFKLNISGNETVLHSFRLSDGEVPAAGVVRDKAGNLYGTTIYGGALSCNLEIGFGCGTVFKLDTSGNETVLHRFTNTPDGAFPVAGLVIDKAGNLYGTTENGGSSGYGTVFKLDITGTETVLHNFTNSPDGAFPTAGLLRDKTGNLYGTTLQGGSSGYGTVFKLSSPQAPKSKEECEHGGYLKFGPPAGPFKNQGQCVSYVEHHRK